MSNPRRELGPRQYSAPTPADGPTLEIRRHHGAQDRPSGFAGDDGPTVPYPAVPPIVSRPPAYPAAPPLPPAPASAVPPTAPSRRSRRKVPIILGVIVLVVVAGLVGGEVFGRNRAEAVVADNVKCATGDTSTVSFAAMPPLLWQYVSGTYPSIRIQTSGNRIRDMQGMSVVIDLHDVRPPVNNSPGSIGSADAALTWNLDGIKETVQKAIPVGGKLLTSVTASQGDGTIKLGNFLASVTVKPKKLDNGTIGLDVVNTQGPGLETIKTLQPALDAYLTKQTLPLNLHADQLSVTDHGVNAHLTSSDANLPAESEKACYTTD